MNKKQIEMLRGLIQAEITYAIEDDVRKNHWSYEMKETNDKYWEQFAETFNPDTTGCYEIDV